MSALERIGTKRLIEANREATELLLSGVEGLPDWDQGRSRTVHYIDWDHPENNDFTAVNQFRVDCPGGQAKGYVTPEVMLFVNGIPVGVVEYKSLKVSEPMAAAVGQLRRYHNQRRADLLKHEREQERPVTGSDLPWLAGLTARLVEVVTESVGVVGFWKNATRQEDLRGQLFQFLDDNEIVEFDRADAVADRLLELAKANHHKLVRQ